MNFSPFDSTYLYSMKQVYCITSSDNSYAYAIRKHIHVRKGSTFRRHYCAHVLISLLQNIDPYGWLDLKLFYQDGMLWMTVNNNPCLTEAVDGK